MAQTIGITIEFVNRLRDQFSIAGGAIFHDCKPHGSHQIRYVGKGDSYPFLDLVVGSDTVAVFPSAIDDWKFNCGKIELSFDRPASASLMKPHSYPGARTEWPRKAESGISFSLSAASNHQFAILKAGIELKLSTSSLFWLDLYGSGPDMPVLTVGPDSSSITLPADSVWHASVYAQVGPQRLVATSLREKSRPDDAKTL